MSLINWHANQWQELVNMSDLKGVDQPRLQQFSIEGLHLFKEIDLKPNVLSHSKVKNDAENFESLQQNNYFSSPLPNNPSVVFA